ncbi:hypothetical protein TMatcc_008049 [Talaromyces marneffei ATCC 18224]|uniref:L-lactate dehydrogenase (cytochrome) n=1 Tax=Talaromyces marneffei PM1 TaxID=1077442 RepID=A0A093VGJ6_TALMA|nr:uncharacterized protein EYB26_004952 [Talaromyces marneffei]KAE8552582.1 hypothetical protein EYB25_003960 [Talaromyces marneffei]QGA17281.1 hypothetical protein EYB26_004952 [Talaromyces marneffei]
MNDEKVLKKGDIALHSDSSDCWIIVNGKVWDVTNFLVNHPGGADVIFCHAGKDASFAYNQVHDPNLLGQTLPSTCLKGTVIDGIPSATPQDVNTEPPNIDSTAEKALPPLSSILSTHDLEAVAKQHLSKKAWAYYSSAATDLVSERANQSLWDRIWFRPRVLRNVRNAVTERKIHGVKTSVPFYVAPAAMAKLAHDDGELAIARACAGNGVVQCICINASYQLEDIINAAPPGTPFLFQLYANKNRAATEAILKRVWATGIHVLFLTVDAPVPGKREADEKVKTSAMIKTPMTGTQSANDHRGSGLTRIMGTYIDDQLNWDDLQWLRTIWKGKIVLKGVQSVEDAMMAVEAGVDGITLSNHGGRNLDTSPPGLMVLLELRKFYPEVFEKIQVHLDGGIRRGTDILKALCLGATSVSLGRPFLYSVLYGEQGVQHLIQILKDELETAMRLVGITDLSQVNSRFVNTKDLDYLVMDSIANGDGFVLKSKI